MLTFRSPRVMGLWVLGTLLSCASAERSDPAPSALAPARKPPEPPELPPPPMGFRGPGAEPGVELPPDPRLVSASALSEFLPNELHGFVAEGPARPHVESNAEAGTQAPSATRNYLRDGYRLRIHVVDATHIPYMRGSIAETMGTFRKTPELTVIGQSVQGQPASVQWSGDSARVGMLVDGQVVVSMTVAPASNHEVGLEIAQRLDLKPLRALIAQRAARRIEGTDGAARPSHRGTPGVPASSGPEPAQAARPFNIGSSGR